MNRLLSYATLMLSRLLDLKEREVALGDIAELGYVGGQACTNMLGLVLRRQMQPREQSRPWFRLIIMIIPIASLLASFCNQLGCKLFPILVMWSRHHVAYATGLRLSAEAFGLSLDVAALLLWSWTFGFAVGALARRTVYVPTIVFCLICVALDWRLGPTYIVLLWTTAWFWLLLVIMCLLVLAPAYHGLYHGAASSKIGRKSAVFLTAGIAVAGILAMWTRGWDSLVMENWSQGGGPLTVLQLVRNGATWEAVSSHLLALSALTLPAFYLLGEEIVRGFSARN